MVCGGYERTMIAVPHRTPESRIAVLYDLVNILSGSGTSSGDAVSELRRSIQKLDGRRVDTRRLDPAERGSKARGASGRQGQHRPGRIRAVPEVETPLDQSAWFMIWRDGSPPGIAGMRALGGR